MKTSMKTAPRLLAHRVPRPVERAPAAAPRIRALFRDRDGTRVGESCMWSKRLGRTKQRT